jgi:hypothetical protein
VTSLTYRPRKQMLMVTAVSTREQFVMRRVDKKRGTYIPSAGKGSSQSASLTWHARFQATGWPRVMASGASVMFIDTDDDAVT